MSLAKQLTNGTAIVLGLLAILLGLAFAVTGRVSLTDLSILAVLYVPTAMGITVGYHRYLSHGAFKTSRFVRYLLATFGSMAAQGPVVEWVSDHRRHHAHAETDADPHSPHVVGGRPRPGVRAGLWHSHVGWLFRTQGEADPKVYAPDLIRDRGILLIDRAAGAIVLAGLALPFGLGVLLSGSVQGGWTGLLWGGFVRIALSHHAAFSVNSICHCFGRRRFQTSDHSRNVGLLALPTLGESWHNNHHAFPTSAFHGLGLGEPDPSGLAIRLMERLGIVWDVKRPRETGRRRRALGAAG